MNSNGRHKIAVERKMSPALVEALSNLQRTIASEVRTQVKATEAEMNGKLDIVMIMQAINTLTMQAVAALLDTTVRTEAEVINEMMEMANEEEKREEEKWK